MSGHRSSSNSGAPSSGEGRQSGPQRPWRCPRDSTCPSATRHDDLRGYWRGCISGLARACAAEYQRTKVDGQPATRPLVDATGSVRKLRALACAGWSASAIGRRRHVTAAYICQIRAGQYVHVTVDTATWVDELWVELSDADPPTGPGVTRTRREAQRHRWLPVEAWAGVDIDDPTVRVRRDRPRKDRSPDLRVIESLADGRVRWADLSPLDRRGAVEHLWGRHESCADVAAALRAPVDEVARAAVNAQTRRRRLAGGEAA